MSVAQKAIERLERGWTKDALARDKYGSPVRAFEPEAVCWCLQGAIVAGVTEDNRESVRLLDAARDVVIEKGIPYRSGKSRIATFNDDYAESVENVIEVLREAEKRMRDES